MDYLPQQYQKIFALCDIIAMEDITVAAAILQQYDWNLQSAIQVMSNQNSNPNHIAPSLNDTKPEKKQPQQPVFNNQDFDDASFDDFQYEYSYNDLQHKKQMFDQQYASFPLKKTTSHSVPDSLQRGLSHDRQLSLSQKSHKFAYTQNIAKNSEILYARILASHPQQKRKIYENNRKINNNKNFIAHLQKEIQPKINFTFGTLLLNLVRSYLEKKFLLVYIHKDTSIGLREQKIQSSASISTGPNKIAQMILTQKEIASFVNKNCVVYGMFDNADDYEVIQKYVPMSDVPAFALFSLDKKKQCEKFMSHYTLVRKSSDNFLQWVAKQIGIPIKKKAEVSKQNQVLIQEQQQPKYEVKISDIVNEQNYQYQEMEKMYNLRRQKSKLQKQHIQHFKQRIETLKKKFENQPQIQSGKTLQIKIRLPLSGKSLLRIFELTDQIKQVFDYVNCFGREEFENECGDFDLTQSFPKISLRDHIAQKIGQVFPDSERENIIVKQI